MAKEIVTYCDVHLTRGEHLPASSVQFTVDQGMPLEVDLCNDCHKELVEPLVALLNEYGQPVKRDTGTSNTGKPLLLCPVCAKQYVQQRGLDKHIEREHPTPAAARAAVQATSGAHQCPECDRSFALPQGLGRHRLSAHGVKGTTRAKKPTKRKASRPASKKASKPQPVAEQPEPQDEADEPLVLAG